jgi:hypothetical protein
MHFLDHFFLVTFYHASWMKDAPAFVIGLVASDIAIATRL